MWTYVYDNYVDEYDYFYICGDDVYVAIDNLRIYLQSPQVENLRNGYLDRISNHTRYRGQAMKTSQLRPRPLLFASPVFWKGYPVISGGEGYLINSAALKIWGEKGADNYATDAVSSREDYQMGQFFGWNNVLISETKDELGGCRFCSGAEFTYYFNGVRHPNRPKKLKEMFGIPIRRNMDHPSKQQISFHLKDDLHPLQHNYPNNTIADLIVRYHALLYHWCD
jgi:hypothetical protein